jgi:hypothetical protein
MSQGGKKSLIKAIFHAIHTNGMGVFNLHVGLYDDVIKMIKFCLSGAS